MRGGVGVLLICGLSLGCTTREFASGRLDGAGPDAAPSDAALADAALPEAGAHDDAAVLSADGGTDAGPSDGGVDCAGQVNGTPCAATECGSYGACGGFATDCAETGTESRSCTDYACMGGVCTSSVRAESRACTRLTSGNTCGTPACTGWSPCVGPTECAESGLQARMCGIAHCAGGSCGAPVDTPETQSCLRGTEGLTCDVDACTLATGTCAAGMCVGTSMCQGSTCWCSSGLCMGSSCT